MWKMRKLVLLSENPPGCQCRKKPKHGAFLWFGTPLRLYRNINLFFFYECISEPLIQGWLFVVHIKFLRGIKPREPPCSQLGLPSPWPFEPTSFMVTRVDFCLSLNPFTHDQLAAPPQEDFPGWICTLASDFRPMKTFGCVTHDSHFQKSTFSHS